MVNDELLEFAKLEFCTKLSLYHDTMSMAYKVTTYLNEMLKEIKEDKIFQEVDFRRLDTIMHNKVVSTLKEFTLNDIDPMFFIHVPTNDYYNGNFYSKFILEHLNYLASNSIKCLNKLFDNIETLYNDKIAYYKHHLIKMFEKLINDENLILTVPKLNEEYIKCIDIYNEYRRLADEFYEFDIKRDYLQIVKVKLNNIFDSDDSDINETITVNYDMDLDYLISMHQEDLVPELYELYKNKLEEKEMDISLIEGEHDKYFTSLVTDKNIALELTKLTDEELNKIISELLFRDLNNQIKANDDYENLDKEIVEFMINFNRNMQGQFKKLEKGLK